MKPILLFLTLCSLLACHHESSNHPVAGNNFTVNRLLIINDQDEVLMAKEQTVWAPPSYLYNQRQFVRESLDSLAEAYGLSISLPELHGQFSFKYDYEPYATIRNYYVAKYTGGTPRLPANMDDVRWVPVTECVALNTVTAIGQISGQILDHPDTVWGGSFLVSEMGDRHPTKMVEPFYPLFTLQAAR